MDDQLHEFVIERLAENPQPLKNQRLSSADGGAPAFMLAPCLVCHSDLSQEL